jgi:hypothetical protein
MVGYLRWAAINHPQSFMAGANKTMPFQINATSSEPRKFRTVAEIRAEIRKLGLPLDARLLEPPRNTVVNADVIDVEGTVMDEESEPVIERPHLPD